jgi:hypothetical protein
MDKPELMHFEGMTEEIAERILAWQKEPADSANPVRTHKQAAEAFGATQATWDKVDPVAKSLFSEFDTLQSPIGALLWGATWPKRGFYG